MNMQIPDDIRSSLESLMVAGLFANEEEVLRVALSEMQNRQSENDLVAIQAGIDDMEAGRTRPWEDVRADLAKKFGFADEPNP